MAKSTLAELATGRSFGLPEVVKAKHVSGFIIATRFDDGAEKHIDISQWFKGPVFKPLKDPKFFAKFFIEGGTLAWPNDLDISGVALRGGRHSTR